MLIYNFFYCLHCHKTKTTKHWGIKKKRVNTIVNVIQFNFDIFSYFRLYNFCIEKGFHLCILTSYCYQGIIFWTRLIIILSSSWVTVIWCLTCILIMLRTAGCGCEETQSQEEVSRRKTGGSQETAVDGPSPHSRHWHSTERLVFCVWTH